MTILEHVSEKPWGDYKSSDYTLQQWHRACLIHEHTGAPTSKIQCKLPVRTPDGALNRNGVHAAAAALAGARGGVITSDANKKSAAQALLRLYTELGEDPPNSLVMHSSVDDLEYLAHHGVKGMKWGVRNDRGHVGERAKTKKIVKADKLFEKQAVNTATWVNIHNRAAELANSHDIDRINNKPQYRNADFTNDSPLRRQYYNEHQQAYISRIRQAAKETGTNASGTREIKIITDKSGNWGVQVVDVKHDAFDDLDGTTIHVTYDARGHILSLALPESMAQSSIDDDVDEFLEHYGVRGMKWGRRKRRGSQDEILVTHPGDSHEHLRTRQLLDTATTHGIHKLSNKELEELNKRLNLEQNYARLIKPGTPGAKAAKVGGSWVGGVLNNVGKQVAAELLKGHVMKFAKNKGFTATT